MVGLSRVVELANTRQAGALIVDQFTPGSPLHGVPEDPGLHVHPRHHLRQELDLVVFTASGAEFRDPDWLAADTIGISDLLLEILGVPGRVVPTRRVS